MRRQAPGSDQIRRGQGGRILSKAAWQRPCGEPFGVRSEWLLRLLTRRDLLQINAMSVTAN